MGYTPLIEASRRRHIEVVKVLVAAGADVNAKDNVRDVWWGGPEGAGSGELDPKLARQGWDWG